MSWEEAQGWEREWWGDCCWTFREEQKQLTYAERMGLVAVVDDGRWPIYDMRGRTVIDMGGGPVSILLKTRSLRSGLVVDPCPYPAWVINRYNIHGILHADKRGEDFDGLQLDNFGGACGLTDLRFDEGWLYNCLQHTDDPERVVRNLRNAAKVIRVFEWIDSEVNMAHPNAISAGDLNRWLNAVGMIEEIDDDRGCTGKAYYVSLGT